MAAVTMSMFFSCAAYPAPSSPRVEAEKEVQAYLSLAHPTYEQRFEFQRGNAKRMRRAEAGGWQELLADRAEGRRDYGLDPDAYDISFFAWRRRPEFAQSAYQESGGAVMYRGVRLEPGDVFLANLASDSDGIYTTLAEGRRSFSHVAVYVPLEVEGKKFPAVIEIHDEGVRAVPLRFFLSDKFVSYAEVYRYRRMPPAARARLGAEALKMIQEVHGFDFYMNESQSVYLTCALTASQLFRRAGLETVAEGSRYDPQKLANIHFLGADSGLGRKLLFPDDFSRSPKLRLVGYVDNDRFLQKMARDLVRDRVQELFVTERLDEKRFPWDFRVYRFAVSSIQNRSWTAPLFLKVLGFRADNFPSGPAMFLALAKPAFERVEESSRTLAKALATNEAKLRDARSWEALEADPDVRAMVLRSTKDFAALYSPPPPAMHAGAAF
jgi:hypothetical protein